MFSVRCKLFALDNQAWKERGVGVLKVNVHKTTNRARICKFPRCQGSSSLSVL